MFGPHGVYHMVPICLAIGVLCPLPFILGVSFVPRNTAAGHIDGDLFRSGTSGQRPSSTSLARRSSCNTRPSSPLVSTPPSTRPWPLASSPSGGCARATRAGSLNTSACGFCAGAEGETFVLSSIGYVSLYFQLHRRCGPGRRHAGHLVHPQLRRVRRLGEPAQLPAVVGERYVMSSSPPCRPPLSVEP